MVNEEEVGGGYCEVRGRRRGGEVGSAGRCVEEGSCVEGVFKGGKGGVEEVKRAGGEGSTGESG